MRKLYLIVFLNFPFLLLSQEWRDNDSIKLKIAAMESYDTRSKEEGYFDFYRTIDSVIFHFDSKLNTFSSDNIKTWKCIPRIYNTRI